MTARPGTQGGEAVADLAVDGREQATGEDRLTRDGEGEHMTVHVGPPGGGGAAAGTQRREVAAPLPVDVGEIAAHVERRAYAGQGEDDVVGVGVEGPVDE